MAQDHAMQNHAKRLKADAVAATKHAQADMERAAARAKVRLQEMDKKWLIAGAAGAVVAAAAIGTAVWYSRRD